jgi:hypothetical protein
MLATTGMTATVTGSLAAGSLALQVQGTVGTYALSGQSLGRTTFGGPIASSSATGVGSWLLTAESAPTTLVFRATVTNGRHKGLSYVGLLTYASTPNGLLDGALVLDAGGTLPATGSLVFGNLVVTVYLPHGELIAVAAQGIRMVSGDPYVTYSGSVLGPSIGDQGAWAAVQTVS